MNALDGDTPAPASTGRVGRWANGAVVTAICVVAVHVVDDDFAAPARHCHGGSLGQRRGPLVVLALAAITPTIGTAVFSNQWPPPDLADLVDRIAPRPILLIHAENGVGGEELNATYHEAAGPPKQLWRVPGSTTSVGSTPAPTSTSSG